MRPAYILSLRNCPEPLLPTESPAFSAGLFYNIVMAGLVPAIHALLRCKDVDARNKCGHDGKESGLFYLGKRNAFIIASVRETSVSGGTMLIGVHSTCRSSPITPVLLSKR